VAKLLTASAEAGTASLPHAVTQTGDLVGTPSYMAPEQAGGKPQAVGPAADVYALGVLLYELFTGRPPFTAPTWMEVLNQVLAEEPVPPRRLQPSLPRDLDTICLKCLQKEPARRYASAEELAADLDRFLEGKPVLARPVGRVERAWKWLKRRPAAAALAALAAAATVLGAAGVAAALVYALAGWSEAARAGKNEAEERRQAVAARDRAEISAYFSLVARAQLEWRLNNAVGADQLLERGRPGPGETDRRGWEWHYLQALNHADLFSANAHVYTEDVAFTPDGLSVAAAGGQPFVPPYTGDVRSWKLDGEGEATLLPPAPGLGFHTTLAFSPDGRRLATGGWSRNIQIWDVSHGLALARLERTIELRFGSSTRMRFSPDGRFLAVSGAENAVQVLDASGGERRQTLDVQTNAGTWAVAFAPDGRTLACGGDAGVRIFARDGDEHRLVQALPGETISSVAYSPDGGRLLAASSGSVVRIWETRSYQLLHTLNRHDGLVTAVEFSPDGHSLATASFDRTVRLWDVGAGREKLLLRGHAGRVHAVAFHPNGRLLASSSEQPGEVKVWDLTALSQEYFASSGGGDALAFSADGRSLCFVRSGNLRVQDALTGVEQRRRSLDAVHGYYPATVAAFSADGGRCITIARENTRCLRATDLSDGSERLLEGCTQRVVQAAVSRDGRRAAARAWDPDKPEQPDEVRVWDIEDRRPLARATTRGLRPKLYGKWGSGGLALSPKGEWLAFDEEYVTDVGADGNPRPTGVRVVVRDAATGAERVRLTGPSDWVMLHLTFSPDGRRLAAVGENLQREEGLVVVWDLVSGGPQPSWVGRGPQFQAAFSPDGRRLAAVDREQVKVWDAETGHEVLVLRPAPPRNADLPFNPQIAWSPDGGRLAATAHNQNISVWDAAERETPAARAALRRQAAERAFAWHLRELRAARRENHSFAVAWRLDRLYEAEPPTAALRLERAAAAALAGRLAQAWADLAKTK
jgi:WD40 repeat protein